MKYKSIVLMLLILLVSLLISGCKPSIAQSDSVKEVTIIQVKPEKGKNISQYSSKLQAIDEVIVSFELPGMIKEMRVEEGSKVNADDLLASLNGDSYVLQLNNANSELQKATDTYQTILNESHRIETLYQAGAISLSAYEASKNQLSIAEKSMISAQTNCSIANLSLSKNQLKAPISGTVISKYFSPGQMVNAGTPIFKLGNINQLKVVLQIQDYDISKWKTGDQVSVNLYGKHKNGIVSKILPSVSEGTGTIGVEAEINNQANDWFAGQVVTCEHVTEGNAAIYVPVEAVISDETKNSYVFLAKGDKAVKTIITSGKMKNDKLEINSGLKSGDRVIVQGADRLFNNDTIRYAGR